MYELSDTAYLWLILAVAIAAIVLWDVYRRVMISIRMKPIRRVIDLHASWLFLPTCKWWNQDGRHEFRNNYPTDYRTEMRDSELMEAFEDVFGYVHRKEAQPIIELVIDEITKHERPEIARIIRQPFQDQLSDYLQKVKVHGFDPDKVIADIKQFV